MVELVAQARIVIDDLVDALGRATIEAVLRLSAEQAAAKDLLQGLVERSVNPERRRLFVIDGSKALRAAINAVFGGAPWCKGAANITSGT